MVVNILSSLWRLNLVFVTICVLETIGARSEFSRPDGRANNLHNILTLVTKWGYPIENHVVTTSDGYSLTLFRIPSLFEDPKKSPVFLQHGLVSCGGVFLANKRSLAYSLYVEGYDVWIGNARGTQFSQHHRKHLTNTKEFWDFSFHEMGIKDVPAVLQFIRARTGKSKIHYIGHSMGTTMFLVMASLLPEELEHIDTVTLMAPVAVPKHMAAFASKIKRRLAYFTVKNLRNIGMQRHKQQKWLGRFVYKTCEANNFVGRMCKRIFCESQNEVLVAQVVLKEDETLKNTHESGEIEENDEKNESGPIRILREGPIRVDKVCYPSKFDHANAEEAIEYFFDGTSWKTHQHFLQVIEAGRFQKFDYEKDNPKEYDGRTTPDIYPITNIKKRIYLMSGGKDTVALTEDVRWLHDRLPDSWLIEEGFQEFTHDSFHLGEDVQRVFITVLRIIHSSEAGVEPSGLPENVVKREVPTEDSERETIQKKTTKKWFSWSKSSSKLDENSTGI
ncbi:tear acid lipase-like protein [Macrosteles quadrilineatus]|uniref:tear acid lipase-like protein n=1 Tax=Macrosteles quadrilineatus TaxID=74068 RepID=UPI0023E188B9|nr:tear acid lipase-like protein [Macrosteles quadrilineatus]